jgi:hypothetical protein
MLRKLLALVALAGAVYIAPAAHAGWECEGTEPFWHIEWTGSLIELKDSSQIIRFKSVDAAEPAGPEHWLWVYQTQSLGSRNIPLTLVVQRTGRSAECFSSAEGVAKKGRFSAVAITPAHVLAGCCEWREAK